MTNLQTLTPIKEGKKIARSPVPPPPKLAWLSLDQLVINADYQRELSVSSLALIRKLVADWDWNRFKPLSVAPIGDGRYEIVDGQHTALAAVTHGAIETLPCVILSTVTTVEKAEAFVGINADRISLTPYALFRARVAAGDDEAVAVAEGLERAGVTLVPQIRYENEVPPGVTACVTTLLGLARRGGKARVRRLLTICKDGGVTPIPAGLLRGLEVLTAGECPADERLSAALTETDMDNLLQRLAAVRFAKPDLHLPQAWAQVVREISH